MLKKRNHQKPNLNFHSHICALSTLINYILYLLSNNDIKHLNWISEHDLHTSQSYKQNGNGDSYYSVLNLISAAKASTKNTPKRVSRIFNKNCLKYMYLHMSLEVTKPIYHKVLNGP